VGRSITAGSVPVFQKGGEKRELAAAQLNVCALYFHITYRLSVAIFPDFLAASIPRAEVGFLYVEPLPTLTLPQSWVIGTFVPVGILIR
jgi:hypothetical protein